MLSWFEIFNMVCMIKYYSKEVRRENLSVQRVQVFSIDNSIVCYCCMWMENTYITMKDDGDKDIDVALLFWIIYVYVIDLLVK